MQNTFEKHFLHALNSESILHQVTHVCLFCRRSLLPPLFSPPLDRQQQHPCQLHFQPESWGGPSGQDESNGVSSRRITQQAKPEEKKTGVASSVSPKEKTWNNVNVANTSKKLLWSMKNQVMPQMSIRFTIRFTLS
jgi:hypothetical protein